MGWRALWLPRSLHPAAWWLWALGLATAASRTTNPLLLALIIAVACTVVAARRTDAPWALAFRLYLVLGAVIVVLRVVFRIVFGGGGGTTVLVPLPAFRLPEQAAGIQLLGDVTAEALLGGFYDGLRLATMVICLGAANALANPKRLLKAVPSALYEVGTAVVVALSVFPQLAESVQRVRRARALRGDAPPGMRALRAIVVPVLEDALDRSLLLAASMDVRGYGRPGNASRGARRFTGGLLVVGLLGVCAGIYGLLDGSSSWATGTPVLLGGLAVAAVGIVASGRRVQRTAYRPDRWLLPEVLTAACGITAGVCLFLTTSVDPTNLNPSLSPLAWPQLSTLPLVGISIAALPAWLTPPPLVDLSSVAQPRTRVLEAAHR